MTSKLSFALRRPDASGEFPLYQPRSIGDVDHLARLALDATLVHQLPLPPIDSLPEAVRRPAPTLHLAEVMPQPAQRPDYHRARHRRALSPWLLAALTLVGGFTGGVLVLVIAVFQAGGPR